MRLSSASALALLLATPALAADPAAPAPGRPGDFTLAAPTLDETASASASGWYLRADGGFGAPRVGGTSLGQLGSGSDRGVDSWTVGGGLGYQAASWLRTDVAADYQAAGGVGSATSFLASGYWDIATWNGLTPYVGGGLGFSVVTLYPSPITGAFSQNDWQFTWALAAGVAWAVTPQVSLDLGYRYVDFGSPDYATPYGQLSVGSLYSQQVRVGLRYAVH